MDDGLEGWHTDPYGRHEARWLSEGRATKLVRDGGVESYDDPPADEVPVAAPIPVDAHPSDPDTEDLRRADDAQQGEQYDPKETRRKLRDLFAQIPWQTH
jgi:hypothetical protein